MLSILGIGKTGVAAYHALKKIGYEVSVWDDNQEKLKQVDDMVVQKPNEHTEQLLVSPGINPNHPLVKQYKEKITTDIELFLQHYKHVRVIGVTGTNGKSTLVSRITHCLQENGVSAVAGGNIGAPVFTLPQADIYVLELSSFQLYYINNIALDLGFILEITEDHLDWHGSFEAYRTAKMRIETFAKTICKHPFTDEQAVQIAGRVAGVQMDMECMKTFTPLPHRLETIYDDGSRKIINDSKSTNPASLAYAVSQYKNITLICGGREKQNAQYDMVPTKNIHEVYIIGEARTGNMAQYFKNKVPTHQVETLENTLAIIKKTNASVILFSPGCASFDQFKNFEHRGDRYTTLTKKLLNQ